jgi:hypothetical protein
LRILFSLSCRQGMLFHWWLVRSVLRTFASLIAHNTRLFMWNGLKVCRWDRWVGPGEVWTWGITKMSLLRLRRSRGGPSKTSCRRSLAGRKAWRRRRIWWWRSRDRWFPWFR